MKKWVKIIIISIALIAGFAIASNLYVEKIAKNRIYNSVNNIPQNTVGLVLGTSKYLRNGQINLFYQYRINAAFELFKSNKIKYLIISGDNGSKYYDEPTTFKDDLVAMGVPESAIYLDYAGFRTLDSMVRCKEIFGQNAVTVISQQFHNERAITLGLHNDINTIGYNAKNVGGQSGLKVKMREFLARTKLSVDLIFKVQPKFLGEPVNIPKV